MMDTPGANTGKRRFSNPNSQGDFPKLPFSRDAAFASRFSFRFPKVVCQNSEKLECLSLTPPSQVNIEDSAHSLQVRNTVRSFDLTRSSLHHPLNQINHRPQSRNNQTNKRLGLLNGDAVCLAVEHIEGLFLCYNSCEWNLEFQYIEF